MQLLTGDDFVGDRAITMVVLKISIQVLAPYHLCPTLFYRLDNDVVTVTEIANGDWFSPSDIGPEELYLKLNRSTSELQSCTNKSRLLN